MKKRAWLATFFDKIDVAGNCEGVRNEQTANCKVKKNAAEFWSQCQNALTFKNEEWRFYGLACYQLQAILHDNRLRHCILE